MGFLKSFVVYFTIKETPMNILTSIWMKIRSFFASKMELNTVTTEQPHRPDDELWAEGGSEYERYRREERERDAANENEYRAYLREQEQNEFDEYDESELPSDNEAATEELDESDEDYPESEADTYDPYEDDSYYEEEDEWDEYDEADLREVLFLQSEHAPDDRWRYDHLGDEPLPLGDAPVTYSAEDVEEEDWDEDEEESPDQE